MTIIRGETVQEVALLSASGELLCSEKEEFVDLAADENQRAFQRGEERGKRNALEENKVFFDLLQTMTRKVLEQKHTLLDQLKPEIIEFALAICERVIRKELTQPQAFVRLINSLLSAATLSLEDDYIQIILSPDDFMLLEKSFDQIHYDKHEIKGIRFASDSLVRRGDCRIETKSGILKYDILRELTDLQTKILQR